MTSKISKYQKVNIGPVLVHIFNVLLQVCMYLKTALDLAN